MCIFVFYFFRNWPIVSLDKTLIPWLGLRRVLWSIETPIWTFKLLATTEVHYMEKNPGMFTSKTLISLRLKKEKHEHLGWHRGEYITRTFSFWKWTSPLSSVLRNNSPQNKNSVIIYSPSCCSKLVWILFLSFFSWVLWVPLTRKWVNDDILFLEKTVHLWLSFKGFLDPIDLMVSKQ